MNLFLLFNLFRSEVTNFSNILYNKGFSTNLCHQLPMKVNVNNTKGKFLKFYGACTGVCSGSDFTDISLRWFSKIGTVKNERSKDQKISQSGVEG
jgi:hypothetical protein